MNCCNILLAQNKRIHLDSLNHNLENNYIDFLRIQSCMFRLHKNNNLNDIACHCVNKCHRNIDNLAKLCRNNYRPHNFVQKTTLNRNLNHSCHKFCLNYYQNKSFVQQKNTHPSRLELGLYTAHCYMSSRHQCNRIRLSIDKNHNKNHWNILVNVFVFESSYLNIDN